MMRLAIPRHFAYCLTLTTGFAPGILLADDPPAADKPAASKPAASKPAASKPVQKPAAKVVKPDAGAAAEKAVGRRTESARAVATSGADKQGEARKTRTLRSARPEQAPTPQPPKNVPAAESQPAKSAQNQRVRVRVAQPGQAAGQAAKAEGGAVRREIIIRPNGKQAVDIRRLQPQKGAAATVEVELDKVLPGSRGGITIRQSHSESHRAHDDTHHAEGHADDHTHGRHSHGPNRSSAKVIFVAPDGSRSEMEIHLPFHWSEEGMRDFLSETVPEQLLERLDGPLSKLLGTLHQRHRQSRAADRAAPERPPVAARQSTPQPRDDAIPARIQRDIAENAARARARTSEVQAKILESRIQMLERQLQSLKSDLQRMKRGNSPR